MKENQQGFRAGRSTAVAAQIFIRIHVETRKTMTGETKDKGHQGKADLVANLGEGRNGPKNEKDLGGYPRKDRTLIEGKR